MGMTTDAMINATLVELMPLRRLNPGLATKGWIIRLARDLLQLELQGHTHFGPNGPRPDVAAWWLTDRALNHGWSHLRLTSYVYQLRVERGVGR